MSINSIFLHQKSMYFFFSKCIFLSSCLTPTSIPCTASFPWRSFPFLFISLCTFSMQYPCSRYILTFYSMHYKPYVLYSTQRTYILFFRHHCIQMTFFFIFLPLHNFFVFLLMCMQLFFCVDVHGLNMQYESVQKVVFAKNACMCVRRLK